MTVFEYVFNPEDYRLLLFFTSITVLILINYPAIQLYYSRFCRKLRIERKLSNKELLKLCLSEQLKSSSLKKDIRSRLGGIYMCGNNKTGKDND